MPAVVRDRDVAVPATVQLDHPATRRLDREHEWQPQLRAIAAIVVAEAELEIRIAGDRHAAAMPLDISAERERRLHRLEIAYEEPRLGRDGPLAIGMDEVARVEATAAVDAVTQEVIAARAEARTGCDSV